MISFTIVQFKIELLLKINRQPIFYMHQIHFLYFVVFLPFLFYAFSLLIQMLQVHRLQNLQQILILVEWLLNPNETYNIVHIFVFKFIIHTCIIKPWYKVIFSPSFLLSLLLLGHNFEWTRKQQVPRLQNPQQNQPYD